MEYKINEFVKKSCTNCGTTEWVTSSVKDIYYGDKYFCDKLCGTSYLIKYDKILKIKKNKSDNNFIDNNIQIYGTLSRKSY
tara:strand:- start:1170 stop:1412 length:243 start_codon:yes stop_codon:yes gene_type:complete